MGLIGKLAVALSPKEEPIDVLGNFVDEYDEEASYIFISYPVKDTDELVTKTTDNSIYVNEEFLLVSKNSIYDAINTSYYSIQIIKEYTQEGKYLKTYSVLIKP